MASPGNLLLFHFRRRFHLRNYSIYSRNDDPQLFIRSVIDQCKIGFRTRDLPISIFHQLNSLRPRPSVIIFNQLFMAMSKIQPHPPFSTVVAFFNQLELSGLRPNCHSLGILANCYSHLGRVDFAFSLLGKRLKLGYPPDIIIINTLLNGLIASDMLPHAIQLFEDMHLKRTHLTPDVVTYSILINALCKQNKLQLALDRFNEMKARGVEPNVVTYSSLLDGLLKNAQIDRAVSLRKEMENDGVTPNIITYNIVINVLCEAGQLAEAEEVFSYLVENRFRLNVTTYNIMIKVLCRQGLLGDATALLKDMASNGCSPNERTYNTIINEFLGVNDVAKALDYLDIMRSQGFAADDNNVTLILGLLTDSNVNDADKALLQKYFLEDHGERKTVDETSNL